MTELQRLAKELKSELGAPPESWQRAQRERFRAALGKPRQSSAAIRLFPALAAALVVVVCALIWVTQRGEPPARSERTLAAGELAAPLRMDDGSSIVLAPRGRGRLITDPTAVRFELEAGRADFDVVRGQKRAWTITAGKNEVRVLGTRFSVTYEPSRTFEVDVERGVVSVQVPERHESVELKAGDHLRGGPGRMEVARSEPKAATGVMAERAQEAPPPPAVSAEPVTSTTATVVTPPRSDDWRQRYQEGKYAEALTSLRASRLAERLEELGPRALSEVADIARLGGDLKLAARALSLLIRQYPRAGEARDARFLLGRVHALSGDRASAIGAFESYLALGRSSQYTDEAVGRLMELYAERGDGERARLMAQRYLSRAPNGPYRRLASSLTK